MYEFSAPMPYEIENIKKLLNINTEIEKSKINSLYFSLPSTCELFTGFEQHRNFIFEKLNFDYWKKLIEFTLSNNCDFIYLLNAPYAIRLENPNLKIQFEKLDKLLKELKQIGVNKIRVANHKLLVYLHKYYPDFCLYASTSLEYKILSEFKNFMFTHPYVKQIVPSHDLIKNFKLLKNIKKLLPNVEIELLVNEGCIYGCPLRLSHAADFLDAEQVCNNEFILSDYYNSNFFNSNYFCRNLERQKGIFAYIKTNNIYPWEIEEYSKIGINKFKLVGRDAFKMRIENYLNEYFIYLKGVDNVKNIENFPINTFIHHLSSNIVLNKMSVKEYKKLLPDINHFKKYGHLCSSYCGVECQYCFKCAEKIQKVFVNKEKENKIRNTSFCV